MYTPPIKIRPQRFALEVVRRLYPDYRGRKYQVELHDSVTLDSHWEGGSRSYYAIVNRSGAFVSVPQTGTPFDGKLSQPPVCTLDENTIVVEHQFFCGRDFGITFHISPALAQLPWLQSGL